MAYEIFKRTATRVETPTLAITTDGRLAINAAGIRILLAEGIGWVLLLWDETNKRMALKAAPRGDKNAYTVSIRPDKRAGSLRAKSFLSHIGWSATRREIFPAGWDEKEKMLEVALPAARLVKSGQTRKQ